MSGFSAEWLALREPYDRRARNVGVLDSVGAAFRDRTSIAVVDLGCGTGSTLRAIGSRLPARQHWRMVDNDLGLLARAAALASPPEVTVAARAVDLARDLELALDGPADLVTTSALLDLVSAEWIERLAVEIAARRLNFYAALIYHGRASFEPAEPFDLEMLAALNRHQRGDKGFGLALGPEAAQHTVRSFEHVGYDVSTGASDWEFGRNDRYIQFEVIAGWASAAEELGGLSRAHIAAWLVRRKELIADGRSTLRISHVDLFATPTAMR
jgi:hypothetical protein